jgi:hypothetical protein
VTFGKDGGRQDAPKQWWSSVIQQLRSGIISNRGSRTISPQCTVDAFSEAAGGSISTSVNITVSQDLLELVAVSQDILELVAVSQDILQNGRRGEVMETHL